MRVYKKSLFLSMLLLIMPQYQYSMENIKMWFPSQQTFKTWGYHTLKLGGILIGLSLITLFALRVSPEPRVRRQNIKHLQKTTTDWHAKLDALKQEVVRAKKRITELDPFQLTKAASIKTEIDRMSQKLNDAIRLLKDHYTAVDEQKGLGKEMNVLGAEVQAVQLMQNTATQLQQSFSKFAQNVVWIIEFIHSLQDAYSLHAVVDRTNFANQLNQLMSKFSPDLVSLLKKYLAISENPTSWGTVLIARKTAILRSLPSFLIKFKENIIQDLQKSYSTDYGLEDDDKQWFEQYKDELESLYKILGLLQKE